MHRGSFASSLTPWISLYIKNIHMSMYDFYMSLRIACVCRILWVLEEHIRSPGVTGSCNLPDVGAETIAEYSSPWVLGPKLKTLKSSNTLHGGAVAPAPALSLLCPFVLFLESCVCLFLFTPVWGHQSKGREHRETRSKERGMWRQTSFYRSVCVFILSQAW